MLGSYLARGQVPRGVGTFPSADTSSWYVPTLGQKPVPMEPWVGSINVVNGQVVKAQTFRAPYLHAVAATLSAQGRNALGPVNAYLGNPWSM